MRSILLSLTLCLYAIFSVVAPPNASAQGVFSYDSHQDIAYGDNIATERQKLDIYVPKDRLSKSKPYPVHVYVHGGAWIIGDKDMIKRREIGSYTSEGIMYVSVNYRLGDAFQHPDNVNDIITASRWIAANISKYGGDPNNMVLSGHSAGAHLVTLASLLTANAGANLPYKAVFPIDTASFDLTKKAEAKIGFIIDRAKTSVFGTDETGLIAASPLYLVRAGQDYPPINIYVTAERAEASAQSKAMHATLTQAGFKSDLGVIEGATHADMNTMIFKTTSQIYRHIHSALKP